MRRNGTWQTGLVLLALVVLGSSDSRGAAPNWPGWRGPTGDGHSKATNLPTTWSDESVAWTVALPGVGHSSPTIWGEKIFLTGALDRGARRVVFCIDRRTKKIAWQHTAWQGTAKPTHSMNGHASPSCVTDGKLIYAFFGEGGLHCYTVEGTPVWKQELGAFDNRWGTASCPVLVGNAVIQLVDSDAAAASITAFDRKSGKQLWKTPRDNLRGWSTPVLIKAGGRDELVVNGHSAVCAYDPVGGKELWRVKNTRGRGTTTVTPGHGLLFSSNGSGGFLTAIRPGGSGDVTETQLAWKVARKSRDIPSPIVIGDYVLIVGLRGGILGCYQARTGKELWLKRLGTNFSASPVSWNGLAFFLNERGETYVVKPGPTPQIVARNSVTSSTDEIFRASLTPLEGQVFLRSNKKLYCLGSSAAGQ